MRTILCILLLIGFGLPSQGMDGTTWNFIHTSIPNITDPVSVDEQTKQTRSLIFADCNKVLEHIKTLIHSPKEISPQLARDFARAFAQMSFLRPDLLHNGYHEVAAKLLEEKLITTADLNIAEYPWQFGMVPQSLLRPHKLDPRTGFHYCNLLHTNVPVYVTGRLPSQFKGDKLLIAGGKKCQCAGYRAKNPHPPEDWYSIDLLPSLEPDLVANAELAQHLHFLPSRRFSVILIEHLDLAGFNEDGIVDQYLRILKPNGTIVMLSSTYRNWSEQASYYEGLYKQQKAKFEARKFVVTPLMQNSLGRGLFDTSWVAIAPSDSPEGAIALDGAIRLFKYKPENYVRLFGGD